MLDGTAVNALKELAQAAQAGADKVVVVDGVKYSTVKLNDPREKEPEPAPLVVGTLSGLAGYLKANIDKIDAAASLVQVEAPGIVRLMAALKGRFQQRFIFAEARCHNRFAAASQFAFGKWMTPEDLIIALQVLFEDAWDRKTVLALLGNIRDEYLKNATDDGVSQAVSVKAGIVLMQERPVPNPVVLAPYRTFSEVEQPSSSSGSERMRARSRPRCSKPMVARGAPGEPAASATGSGRRWIRRLR